MKAVDGVFIMASLDPEGTLTMNTTSWISTCSFSRAENHKTQTEDLPRLENQRSGDSKSRIKWAWNASAGDRGRLNSPPNHHHLIHLPYQYLKFMSQVSAVSNIVRSQQS